MIIDTRKKRNGRTVVPAAAAAVATAKLEALKQSRNTARPSKGKAVKPEPVIVPAVGFDHEPKAPMQGQTLLPAKAAANPLSWSAYSKDVNISISGLGSTRQFKRYPGKSFPMAAAVWRESPAEAESAMKAAEKAAAKAKKSASGAALSL